MSRERALLGGLGLLLLALAIRLVAFDREEPETLFAKPRADSAPRSEAVVATAETFAPHAAREAVDTERSVPPPPDAAAPAAFSFEREDLYGTVLDRDTRAPVAGASVKLFEPTGIMRPDAVPSAVLTTDAAGRFRLADLGAFERRAVLVVAEGYATEAVELETGGAREVSLGRAVRLAGRVLRRASREPVEGVEVWLDWGWKRQGLLSERVRTDELGRFLLGDVPQRMTASLLFAESGSVPSARALSTGTESVEGLELLLPPLAEIRLRLVELASGVPLAGLRGRIEKGGAFEADGAGIVVLRHDPERLAAESNGFPIGIEGEGTCRTRVLLALDELEELHDVPLTRGARLEGRVQDSAGRPIAGALVSLPLRDRFPASASDVLRGLPPGVSISSTLSSATTDEAGAFVLERLFLSERASGERSARLSVQLQSWLSAALPVEIPAPGGTRWVEVVLQRGAAVRGRVLQDGAPVPGAKVSALPATSDPAPGRTRPMPAAYRMCVTNDGGEYELDTLAPGPIRLEVRGGDDRSRAAETVLGGATLTLLEGETLEHDLHVRDPRGAIEGTVRDASGAPIAGAAVFFRGDSYSFREGEMITGFGGGSVTSGADGRFRLSVPPDSAAREIVAWRAGVEASALAVPGASDVELVLPPAGTLRLSVRDPGGEEIAHVSSILLWPAGTPRERPVAHLVQDLSPRGNGRFELELETGRWDLEVHAMGFAPGLVHGVEVRAAAAGEAEVRLARGTTLAIELAVEPAGTEAPDTSLMLLSAAEIARLALDDDRSAFLVNMHDYLEPEQGGKLVVPGLAPGSYTLVNFPSGWSLDPVTFDVPDVERHEIQVRLGKLAQAR